MLAEGVEWQVAPVAELGLAETAAAEIVAYRVPAQINGARSRHGGISLRGPLAPPVESSPGLTRHGRCASPDGHH